MNLPSVLLLGLVALAGGLALRFLGKRRGRRGCPGCPGCGRREDCPSRKPPR